MRKPDPLMYSLLACAVTLCAQEGNSRPRPMPVGPRSNTVIPTGAMRDTARGGNPVGPRTASAPSPRTTVPHVRLADSTQVWTPWVRQPLNEVPTAAYWGQHNLLDEIRLRARTGFIPATPFPEDQTELQDYTWASCGWRTYGFLVPPGGTVQVALSHPKPGWFHTFWTDKWGEYRPGMKVRIGEPEALYENPTKDVQAVYLLVDDPGFWSSKSDPYTLKVTRNFDPKTMDRGDAKLAVGIWATPPLVDVSRR